MNEDLVLRKKLLNAFEELLVEAFQCKQEKEAGICLWIDNYLHKPEQRDRHTEYYYSGYMSILFKSWPKFSGSKMYPVPAPWYWWFYDRCPHTRSMEYFQRSVGVHDDTVNGCWKGRNLALRIDLIRHCIDTIKKDIAAYES